MRGTGMHFVTEPSISLHYSTEAKKCNEFYRMIATAMEGTCLQLNIFTNFDSAVIVDF